MRKYGHVINIGIQNTLVYRVNFLFRSVFGLIPLTATIMLWRAIYDGKPPDAKVSEYTLAQMISYYLLVTIVDALTAVTEDDWQIAADIKDGNISQFLLKPIDYLAYRLCLFLSGRLIYTAVALVPVGLFILYLHQYFVLPPDVATFGGFLISVVMTGLLQFFISYTMALLAFWVLEVATFIFILFAFEDLAGGHLFPLNILPPVVAQALEYTPFPYLLFFPVSVYLGQRTGAMLWHGLLIQAGWVLFAYALARFVWSRGIKKVFCRGRLKHMKLNHYFSIYAALWKNSVVREMGFKTNFIMWIIVELLWFALQLSFMAVIYSHTERIATWSKWEVIMLLGASHFIQQIFTAIFLTNCTQLSEYIRTGKLDFMLLLPINTRFMISFRQVDLGGFVNAAAAVGVMIYAARQLHLALHPLQIIGFLLLALVGILIHYSLMFCLSSVSFWTVRAQGIVWGYYNLFNIARLPDAAFRGLFKAFFTFAIPMLLVANVPVKVLVKPLEEPMKILLLIALSVVCFAFSEWIWRHSLKHYTSASS